MKPKRLAEIKERLGINKLILNDQVYCRDVADLLDALAASEQARQSLIKQRDDAIEQRDKQIDRAEQSEAQNAALREALIEGRHWVALQRREHSLSVIDAALQGESGTALLTRLQTAEARCAEMRNCGNCEHGGIVCLNKKATGRFNNGVLKHYDVCEYWELGQGEGGEGTSTAGAGLLARLQRYELALLEIVSHNASYHQYEGFKTMREIAKEALKEDQKHG